MILSSLLALGSFMDKNSTTNATELGASYWDWAMDEKTPEPSGKRHIGTEVFERAIMAQKYLRTTSEYYSVRSFKVKLPSRFSKHI